jgi:hypothetical protein
VQILLVARGGQMAAKDDDVEAHAMEEVAEAMEAQEAQEAQ